MSGPGEAVAPGREYRMDQSDPAYPGQAAYTPRLLRVYDHVVVRFSNTFVWRCRAARILQQYDRYLAASHLDIGPGTGFYLERARFPTPTPQVTLLDPNPAVLEHTAARIARLRPTAHSANALEPIDLPPLEDLGLSAQEYGILSVFETRTEFSTSELARVAQVTRQTMHAAILRLESAGLLERRAKNQRVVLLHATRRGRDVLRAATKRVRVAERAAFAGLSKQEEATVRAWLAGLATPAPAPPPAEANEKEKS